MAPPCGFARARNRSRTGGDRLLARRAGGLAGDGQRRLGDLLARCGAMPSGRERFRRLGYGCAPSLARIAVAEAECCGTCRKIQAGAACSLRTAADRAGRLACASLYTAAAGQGPMIVAGPRQNGEGNAAHEFEPATPARQLLQDVRPHQPDEPHARELPQQPAQCVDRVARAEHRLDRACDDAAAVRDAARGCQAPVERRHAAPRLQRIAGRHEQPDLIEPQSPAREVDDVAMALDAPD